MIMCVGGTVAPAALGHCQIHEHIWVHHTPMAEKNPALRIDRYDASLAELREYRRRGGSAIVDAQPVAAGRDAEVLRRLSAESGVNIIASTGYHLLGFYPGDSWVHALDEDGLTGLYLSELREGMLPHGAGPVRPSDRTDIPAGIVKAAIPAEGPEGRYGVLLRAAARAAALTGTPLMLHTESGKNALRAIQICGDEGVPPKGIIVCHADRQAEDFGPHREIAAAGVYLDYDTVGRFKYHSDAAEAALLNHMSGYADKILLSLDTTAARLAAYGGEIGLTYIFDEFKPRLQAMGFGEDVIRAYNRENCRKAFEDAKQCHCNNN